MTHPTFDTLSSWLRFDVSSSDPYLRETLFQLLHCELFSEEFAAEKLALEAELATPEMIERLRLAITAEDDQLRVKSARRLVSALMPDSESILLLFLNSSYFYDRMELAGLGNLFHSEQVVKKLCELALGDPDSCVRAQACRGLLGQDLRVAIPVLLHVMNEDGADIDSRDQTTYPSEMAALVLDDLLGTSFIEVRLGDGRLMDPPGGYQPEALAAKAKEVLENLISSEIK